MALQRLFIATVGGDAGEAAADLLCKWRDAPAVDVVAVDRFCTALRDNGALLPIVYFSEWVDRWLMGDLLPGSGAVEGRQFQVASFTRAETLAWSERCGNQHQEQEWLAARLREAASAWSEIVERVTVVVVREVLGGLTTDEEVRASEGMVPSWLADEYYQ